MIGTRPGVAIAIALAGLGCEGRVDPAPGDGSAVPSGVVIECVSAVSALPAVAKARLRCGATQGDWRPGEPAVLAGCAKGDRLEIDGPYRIGSVVLGSGDVPLEGALHLRVLPIDVSSPVDVPRPPMARGVHAYLAAGGSVILRRELEGALVAEARGDVHDPAGLARQVRALVDASAPFEWVVHAGDEAAFDDVVGLAAALADARTGLTPEAPLRVVPEPLPQRDDVGKQIAESGALTLDLARPDAEARLRRALETCGLLDTAPAPPAVPFSFAAELRRRATPERLGLCPRDDLTALLVRLASVHARREQPAEAIARLRQARVVDARLALPPDASPALRDAWSSKVGLGYAGANNGDPPRVKPAIAFRVDDASGALSAAELEAALQPAAPYLAACCAPEAPYARCEGSAQLVVGVDGRTATPSVTGPKAACMAHALRSLPAVGAKGPPSGVTRARVDFTVDPGL